jgi:lysophospholipase L1-like esterase
MNIYSILKLSLLVMLLNASICGAQVNKQGNGTILYHTDFKKGIQATDFANPGQWTKVKGGITSTTTGLKKYLMLFRQYSVNKRMASVRVSMGKDTRLNFFTVEMDNFHMWGTLIQADAANGVLRIFSNYNADSAAYPQALTSHPYKFIPGRDYTLSMLRDNDAKKFIITNHTSGKTDTLASTHGTTGGLIRDGFAIATESGTPPIVKSFTVSTAYKKGMKLLYMGDSITEGLYTVPDAFYQHGQAALSGRSAGNVYGAQNRVLSELAILKPKYVSILIGTNPGNNLTNLTNLCQSILKLGITPVLNNLPWKYNGSVVEDNLIIAGVRQSLGIKGAAFDIATSLNGLNKQQDKSIFPDGVHPDAIGVQRMYRQLKKDVPELFE